MSPHETGGRQPQRQTETTFTCGPHDLISKFKQGNISRNGLLGPPCPENAYFIIALSGQDSESAHQRPDKASRRPLEVLSPAVSPAPWAWGAGARRQSTCLQLRPRPVLGLGRCLPSPPQVRAAAPRRGWGWGEALPPCRNGLPALQGPNVPTPLWDFSR